MKYKPYLCFIWVKRSSIQTICCVDLVILERFCFIWALLTCCYVKWSVMKVARSKSKTRTAHFTTWRLWNKLANSFFSVRRWRNPVWTMHNRSRRCLPEFLPPVIYTTEQTVMVKTKQIKLPQWIPIGECSIKFCSSCCYVFVQNVIIIFQTLLRILFTPEL